MSRAAKTVSRDRIARMRELIEFVASPPAPTGQRLTVDEAAGIIYRVKVLGRFSRNNHGLVEAENGTDYLPCMKQALRDYEERKVKCNHPANRAEPGKERPIEDTLGVLRNCVLESDEHGELAIWADLHCLTAHPMYLRVIEDVKKGLGVYGLSHNAAAKRERFDTGARRLVIEELALVRSVDLVDKPATNRNLWESERTHMNTTLRELLESRRPKWSKARRLWANVLLEDDLAPAIDAPVAAPDGGDEEDALWSGFQAAIQKVLDQYKDGSIDAKEAGKKIADWIKAHDKLSGADEPEAPSDKASSGGGDAGGSGGDKSDKQESEELVELRREKKARELCESLGYTPTALQIEAVAGIKDAKRQRELAESYKPEGGKGGYKPPRSAAPGTVNASVNASRNAPAGDKKTTPRDVQESEETKRASVAADLDSLRS